jgi:hypothetical protein
MALHRTGRDIIHNGIAAREPFKTSSGSVSGRVFALDGDRPSGSLGQLRLAVLSGAERVSLGLATFVVYSYQTPIAWHSDTYGWTAPALHYSPTTSNHQHVVEMGIHYASVQS